MSGTGIAADDDHAFQSGLAGKSPTGCVFSLGGTLCNHSVAMLASVFQSWLVAPLNTLARVSVLVAKFSDLATVTVSNLRKNNAPFWISATELKALGLPV